MNKIKKIIKKRMGKEKNLANLSPARPPPSFFFLPPASSKPSTDRKPLNATEL